MSILKHHRLVVMLLVVALALGVLAPAALAQDEPISIGFAVHVIGNPFVQQIIDGGKAAASDLGVNLSVGGSDDGNADEELQAAQNFAAAGAQGIAVSLQGESMANGLNDLVANGIPVAQFNLLSTSVKGPYVGEKSTQSGRILGKMVLDKLGGASATGDVIIGNCFPGLPVLENRGKGVIESLKAAPGLNVLGPFDVKVGADENYNNWQQQYAAHPDAVAMIGLCAPDVESLGKLNSENGDKFIAGGYDLTPGNLTAIKEGHAYVTLGQSPFVQGYLPVAMLDYAIKNKTTLPAGFINAGTQVVTADSVDMGNGLPAVSFDELLKLSADPAATAEFYKSWSTCITASAADCSRMMSAMMMATPDASATMEASATAEAAMADPFSSCTEDVAWKCLLQPIEAESA